MGRIDGILDVVSRFSVFSQIAFDYSQLIGKSKDSSPTGTLVSVLDKFITGREIILKSWY